MWEISELKVHVKNTLFCISNNCWLTTITAILVGRLEKEGWLIRVVMGAKRKEAVYFCTKIMLSYCSC